MSRTPHTAGVGLGPNRLKRNGAGPHDARPNRARQRGQAERSAINDSRKDDER